MTSIGVARERNRMGINVYTSKRCTNRNIAAICRRIPLELTYGNWIEMKEHKRTLIEYGQGIGMKWVKRTYYRTRQRREMLSLFYTHQTVVELYQRYSIAVAFRWYAEETWHLMKREENSHVDIQSREERGAVHLTRAVRAACTTQSSF